MHSNFRFYCFAYMRSLNKEYNINRATLSYYQNNCQPAVLVCFVHKLSTLRDGQYQDICIGDTQRAIRLYRYRFSMLQMYRYRSRMF